ncbi:putative nodulation protein nolNO [Methylococcus capsulatus str. Bath]|uniref:Putative nodulation protein nolNO n=2 Tax=Methylococcaceae TaxID=403 RepID=Q607W3_METCA|nr:putative nodulation protein nolNO [Methylococcus capsulatus str. Bath]QXP90951.1 nodulation protein nolNO [Methylococcus capsulatus]
MRNLTMRPSKARTYYLGLCLTYHDPALAIVGPDGGVLFAEAAERRLQSKRALNTPPDDPFHLPLLLQEHCADAREFVVASNWRATRPLHEHLAHWLGWLSPRGILTNAGRRVHTWLEPYQIYHMQAAQHHALKSRLLNLARTLRRDFPGIPVRIRGYDHHLCHAALACYASPFDTAACAVIDSYGETGSMAFFDYRDGRLRPIARQRGPQSLGFYYMKLTELCGFDWTGGEEWKVMGLAAYGHNDPEILACLHDMMTVDGLELLTRYPVFFDRLRRLEARRRRPGQAAEAVANLAHSGQRYFSDTVHRLLSHLHDRLGSPHLALAGGCALNSVCNGRILESTPFQALYVPPAPADDGTALGAAWLAYREDHPGEVFAAGRLSPYLGSAVPAMDAERFAHYAGLPVRHLPGELLIDAAAELLVRGKILGWVQGRAEFGPRALGNRSILADPRRGETGERINREVKFRERFRPYAPAVLHEHGPNWFLSYQESPYMERTLRFRPEVRESVPAVVHVDGTGRLQTVNPEWNPRFHDLLARFHRQSGVPLLLNTSFNVMGKPIVHGLEDAFGVFLGSGMDALAIGDYLFIKPETPP